MDFVLCRSDGSRVSIGTVQQSLLWSCSSSSSARGGAISSVCLSANYWYRLLSCPTHTSLAFLHSLLRCYVPSVSPVLIIPWMVSWCVDRSPSTSPHLYHFQSSYVGASHQHATNQGYDAENEWQMC